MENRGFWKKYYPNNCVLMKALSFTYLPRAFTIYIYKTTQDYL